MEKQIDSKENKTDVVEKQKDVPDNKSSNSSLDADDGVDEFEDACESQLQDDTNEMTLTKAFYDAKLAIGYFFNNKFSEAEAIMSNWAETSMYHASGAAAFSFLSATLTFEQDMMKDANAKLKHCLSLCDKNRRKRTFSENITTLVKKENYQLYTDLELHAELCYAEVLLLRAILTFIKDEELLSFIKGSFKIKQCFNIFKECALILEERSWDDEDSKMHFESGVRMGIGAFNLMISLLPKRIIRLLEFVGFSGDRELGLKELMTANRCEEGLRNIHCALTLLAYNLITCYILTDHCGNLELCEEIIARKLKLYPTSTWFLFYKGRLQFVKGNLEEANTAFIESWKSQNVWPQFHHVIFWELMWTQSLGLKWRETITYCDLLLESSKWSRTIYLYQKASAMIMIWDSLSQAEKDMCTQLMKEAPTHKKRIAGKSIPMEKFVIKRCDRYLAQGNRLLLPVIETMYLWNMFRIFRSNFSVGDKILRLIETTEKDNSACGVEERALIFLLKGATLRNLGAHYQALECLESVIEYKPQIKEDLYLVPFAILELGLLFNAMGDKAKAIATLEDARKNYSKYSMESRLHFHVHAALTDLKSS